MSTKAKAKKQKLDSKLDEALDETFPASDPVSVGNTTSTEPPARPVDRKAPLIDKDEVAAARRRKSTSS